MDAQNTQDSPSSQFSSCLKEKLKDEMVNDEHQTIPDAVDHQIQQPHPQAEQIPEKTHPCPHCDKTFDTHRALCGHQNAHRRLRASAKKKVKTSLSYQPDPTNYPSYPNYKPRALNQIFSHKPSFVLQSETQPATTSVPPENTNTRFFGVQDFFRASSASGNTPSNEAGNFISLEDEKEKKDASGLDLDLKL